MPRKSDNHRPGRNTALYYEPTRCNQNIQREDIYEICCHPTIVGFAIKNIQTGKLLKGVTNAARALAKANGSTKPTTRKRLNEASKKLQQLNRHPDL